MEPAVAFGCNRSKQTVRNELVELRLFLMPQFAMGTGRHHVRIGLGVVLLEHAIRAQCASVQYNA